MGDSSDEDEPSTGRDDHTDEGEIIPLPVSPPRQPSVVGGITIPLIAVDVAATVAADQLIKDQDSDDRKTVVDLLGKLLEPGPSDRQKHFSRGEAATFVLAVADGAACI